MVDTVYEQTLNFYSRKTRGNTNNPIVSLYHEIGYNLPEFRLEFRKSPEKQESLVPEEKQQEPSLNFNTYEDLLKLEIKTVRRDMKFLTQAVSPNRHSPSPDDNPLNKSYDQIAVDDSQPNYYDRRRGDYQNGQQNYNEEMVGFIDKSGQGAELEPEVIDMGGEGEVSAIPIRPDTLMQPEQQANYAIEHQVEQTDKHQEAVEPVPEREDKETQTQLPIAAVEQVKQVPEVPYEPIEPPTTPQLPIEEPPVQTEEPAPEPKKIPFRMAKKEEKKKRKKMMDEEERRVDEMLGIGGDSQIRKSEEQPEQPPELTIEPITSSMPQVKPQKSPINSENVPIGTVLQKKSFSKNFLKKSPIRKLGNSQTTTDSEQRPEEEQKPNLTSDEKKKLLSSFFSMNNE